MKIVLCCACLMLPMVADAQTCIRASIIGSALLICPTEALRPSSGNTPGDLAVTQDTQRLWIATSPTAWAVVGPSEVGAAAWGAITGTLANQTDLQTALDAKLATNGNGGSLTGLTKTQVGLGNVDNTSDASKNVLSATKWTTPRTINGVSVDGTANVTVTAAGSTLSDTVTVAKGGTGLTALGTALQVLRTNAAANAAEWATPAGGANYRTLVTLGGDVTDSAGASTYVDCTGLSFAVTSGTRYHFYAQIWYTSAANTTGSKWAINGPAATNMAYKSTYTLAATTVTTNFAAAYDIPTTANATSLTTTNTAILEGTILPSANGTVIVRFATEVDTSAVVCKAGSTLEWW